MHRTIEVTGYIGPLAVTSILAHSPDSPIVFCVFFFLSLSVTVDSDVVGLTSFGVGMKLHFPKDGYKFPTPKDFHQFEFSFSTYRKK